ncbi:unnamed protein product [Tuber melanosporum]|uniref:(Perigord truffle) hypothetical protein n=1 Tax=Tuber melanosporum (strain Mel28) TaxID=656061 RepID=D5G6X7_TUBMM|nr:uncharacterized protein GSTUM_00002375001 [Tuber melanosporum]CAZ80270.1 unnamed protein product [Tuber melanosporum]
MDVYILSALRYLHGVGIINTGTGARRPTDSETKNFVGWNSGGPTFVRSSPTGEGKYDTVGNCR